METITRKVEEWVNNGFFSDKVFSCLQTLYYAVAETCIEEDGKRKWGRILKKQKCFSNFLMKVIDNDYEPHSLLFVCAFLRNLIEFANGVGFPQKDKLEKWLGERDKSPLLPILLREQKVNTVPELLHALQEITIPKVRELPNKRKPQQIKSLNVQGFIDLLLSLTYLSKKPKSKKEYQEDLFLKARAIHLMNCLNSDPGKIEDITCLSSNLSQNWEEFLKYKKDGTMECDAYLLHMILQVRPFSNEDENEFMGTILEFRNNVDEKVEHILKHTTNSSPFKWEELKDSLEHLKEGNVSMFDQKEVTFCFQEKGIPEVADHTSDKESEGQGPSKQSHVDLLQKYGLTDYYPAKICLGDVIEIDKQRDCKSLVQVPWRVLQKLIMLDPEARDETSVDPEGDASEGGSDNMQSQEETSDSYDSNDSFDNIFSECAEQTEGINPLDLLLLIYLCCDLNLRQVLLEKMYNCHLALPLIFPSLSTDDLSFSLWALRSITLQWKNDQDVLQEDSMVSQPMNFVSFIRMGRPKYSKSEFVNSFLNDRANRTFFNTTCSHADVNRVLADGLVETFCQNSTTVLNLRGDALEHTKQLDHLAELSDVLVVFIDKSDITKPPMMKAIKKLYEKSSAEVILLLGKLDKHELSENNKFIRGLKNLRDSSGGKLTRKNIITRSNKTKVMDRVKELLKDTERKSIKEVSQMVSEAIKSDETDGHCKEGKEFADIVIKLMSGKSSKSIKEEMLPLQGRHWQQWTTLLKEENRLFTDSQTSKDDRTEKNSRNSMKHIDDLHNRKIKLRQEQLEICENPSTLIKTFITSLICLIDRPSMKYFLQELKLYFEKRPREKKNTQHRGDCSESEETLKEDCNEAEVRMRNTMKEKLREESLGLEHLFREIGQIYEAVHESNIHLNKKSEEELKMLPEITADLFVKGHPLELVDGDTYCVPLTWLKAVFESVHELVKDKKIFTISTLGTQSSGKTTMLNTMFGLQLPVSAGRCTKGVCMQIVQVKKGSSLPFDYVVVLDTEGLQGDNSESWNHDIELATFAVGLGDLTIMNIKGEIDPTMHNDVLPTVVRALLRMKRAYHNVHKERSCLFIHQNVPAVDAPEKLMLARERSKEILDNETKQAANLEGDVDTKTFTDVITFDVEHHVVYLPNHEDVAGHMHSASHEYHEKVQKEKSHIFDVLVNHKGLYFKDLILNIQDMWAGILQDNFIFGFASRVEAKAYHRLESELFKIKIEMSQQVEKWLLEEAMKRLDSSASTTELKENHTKLVSELDERIQEREKETEHSLRRFFLEDDYKNILYQWEESKLKSLTTFISDLRSQSEEELESMSRSVEKSLEIRKKFANFEKTILTKAVYFAKTSGCAADTDVLIEHIFKKNWEHEIGDFPSDETSSSTYVQTSLKYELNFLDLPKGVYSDMESMWLAAKTSVPNMEITHSDMKQAKPGIYGGWGLFKWLQGFVQDPIERARNATEKGIDCIRRKVECYLTDLKSSKNAFQQKHVTNILQMLKKEFTALCDDVRVNYDFTVEESVLQRLAVWVCHSAYSVFINMKGSTRETEEEAYLNEMKSSKMKLFKDTVNKTREENNFIDQISDRVEQMVIRTVEGILPSRVADDISLSFGKKQELISAILKELADEENFDKIMEYIQDPQTYASNWVRERTNNNYFRTSDGRYPSKYQGTAADEIDNMIKSVCLKVTKTCTGAQSLKEWLDTFSTETGIVCTPADAETLSEYCISDLEKLNTLLGQSLDTRKEQMHRHFFVKNDSLIQWKGKTPYRVIIDRLWGCHEVCPFCSEPCNRSDPYHTTNDANIDDWHECVQHRPVGLCGGSQKKKLMVSNCAYNIQTDLTYSCACDGCEPQCQGQHLYRQYNDNYPGWKIAPSPTMETSHYWMWVMATFKSQLMQYYGSDQLDIPEHWAGISKERAKASLSDIIIPSPRRHPNTS